MSQDTQPDDLNDLNVYNGENRCICCNVDMGECNPRQYCCKTYCPHEILFDPLDFFDDYNPIQSNNELENTNKVTDNNEVADQDKVTDNNEIDDPNKVDNDNEVVDHVAIVEERPTEVIDLNKYRKNKKKRVREYVFSITFTNKQFRKLLKHINIKKFTKKTRQ
jgi:hypothetical protein